MIKFLKFHQEIELVIVSVLKINEVSSIQKN